MTSRNWLISTAALVCLATPAFADTNTENYVRSNANDVLRALSAPNMDAAGRRAEFQIYMNEFTNTDAVAKFVIGKYAKRFTDEEMTAYQAAFGEYALAIYEYYFNAYKGREVDVTGSIDRNTRDSIVDTTIMRADGRAMNVRWRVLKRGGKYQVVDIALSSEGNLIWLAIEQQAQLIALLDRTNGSADALTRKVEELTQQIIDKRVAG